LQHIPIPVIGVDDEGLMAFVNAAAEDLFAGLGPLLGVELAYTLPTLDAAIQGTKEGAPCDVLIDGVSYCARWNTMGLNSPARGKLLTVNPKD
jgi:nitrogen fixation/metabolism regulation signal transduction histidine kinase